MQRFPVAVSTVRPLYFPPLNSTPVSNYNSRDRGTSILDEKKLRSDKIDKHPFSLETPDSIKLEFNCTTAVEVLQTNMYEPISDCVGNVIIPRYSIGNGALQHQQSDDEVEEQSEQVHENNVQMTICDNNKMSSGMGDNCIDIEHINLERNYRTKFASVAVQTLHLSPYRLRFWPQGASNNIKCIDGGFLSIIKCCLKTLSQWFLSQIGLALFLILWALLGAAGFYHTEGPRERQQIKELNRIKHETAIELSTDLRQISEHDLMWSKLIEKYLLNYDTMLFQAVSAGYGEGGDGKIWTYPGCILFAVSLLTTLGFGAPVPRSSLARGIAVLFSAIGIPLHFLLIINIGTMIAGGLRNLATTKPTSDSDEAADFPEIKRGWLKWFPFLVILSHYTIGFICFGVIRKLPVVESLMFPLNFTAAGGVAKTPGHVRILYAVYLEVAVTIASTSVSLLRVSALNGIIDLGIKFGLLTNT